MAREYQKHDENFKKIIVSLHENGKGISELAREYGLSKSSVSDWIKKYQNIITSTGEVTNNDEITKLKKELSKKEKEIEILKKAVAIFSEEQKIK